MELRTLDAASWRSLRRKKTKTGLVALWNLFNKCCAYCGDEVPLSHATRDHVKPKAAGGRRKGNLVLSCRTCNEAKGCMELGVDWNLTREARQVLLQIKRLRLRAGLRPRR